MANRIANPDQHIPEYVRGYVATPRETFNCELKPWIDPSANDYDRVKLAKACLALRNSGGGVLLVGLSDDGEVQDLPDDYHVEVLFTQDSIQAIVSKYSAQAFSVDVYHIHLEEPTGRRVVAIVIPGGSMTPAMCKKDSASFQTPRVREGIIYTRTVESNGTISSAPASQQDLEAITKHCFDSRVADIGQFLRNHLTDENLRVMKAAANTVTKDHRKGTYSELEAFAKKSAKAFTSFANPEGDE